MKKLFVLTFLILAVHFTFAQCNTFYPIKEGVRYEYNHLDKKDKVTMRTINTFKNVSGSGNNIKATLQQEIIDAKKDKSMGTSESEWVCENGVLHFTMNSMSMMEGGQQGEGMEVNVTGDKMDIPSELKVGQSLKDMNYNIKMSMSGMSIMNRDFKVKDRKVEKEESITTPAGTFQCMKMTFTTSSEKGLGSGTIKSAMWIAKDVGMVQTETYKEDGKPNTKQVLTKIVKN
jgi:hypothetical protein